ncbi:molybdopterin molybdotransferase MoeA [Desulfoscipio gibsoniae]|uniref:Molybdopterin molybdenumtransferase n=1 Tax=Desulfoscipio gibsoniae DSM 7213 TaxID=767817 RepID=R4KKH1_9FIRM|nr:molybdopterin molybdotransferase MoeA [Desulfoscipio gibsoniae]AGL03159.1 molybdopterin biosynthesis enzyme [Desulfoscipio gibsoniae DSM 7213]
MQLNVNLEKALEYILSRISPLPGESIPLMQALGRVAFQDLLATRDLPSHPQASLDGYALHINDLGRLDSFKVQERLRNGELPRSPLIPGHAVGVVTGGPLPGGTGAVIAQELVTVKEDRVIFTGKTPQGSNIKTPGEDFRAGDLLARGGTRFDAGLLGVLAAFGNSEVMVYRRPRVMILSLGSEIVPFHAEPVPGQIWDSNGPLVASLVTRNGGQVVGVEVVSEKTNGVKEHLLNMLKQADLVLTIGGGASGVCDNALSELQGIGADILFWGVQIKPGSHSGAAIWESKPIISLSGNPAACAVGYQLLAAPVIRAFQSLDPYPHRLSALCPDPYPKKGGPRRFLRGLATCHQDGWRVSLQPGQKNSMLRSLIGCNALVELPAGHPPLEPGSRVSVLLLNNAYTGMESQA